LNLDSKHYQNLILWEKPYIWIGIKTTSKFPNDSATTSIFFKENGGGGSTQLSGKVIEVRKEDPKDPEHRLPSFEYDATDTFYLKVEGISSIKQIEFADLHFFKTGKVLDKNGQGVQGINLICDPLPD
jgi:hypothetical protein